MMINVHKALLATLVLAGLALAPGASVARSPGNEWLTLYYSRSGCSYSLTAKWAGANGAKSVEMWLEENGARISPTHVETVNSKSGTLTYTFPALASSPTSNNFHGWAQLLDGRGNPIAGTKDFSSIDVSFCTAP
jgi:hypothetical protein